MANDTHYHLEVDGIPCPSCLYGIEKKLGSLEGVTDIKSGLKNGRFFVKVAEGTTLSEEEVQKAVTDAGFTLRSFTKVEEALQ